jgi:hypothetical protein
MSGKFWIWINIYFEAFCLCSSVHSTFFYLFSLWFSKATCLRCNHYTHIFWTFSAVWDVRDTHDVSDDGSTVVSVQLSLSWYISYHFNISGYFWHGVRDLLNASDEHAGLVFGRSHLSTSISTILLRKYQVPSTR